MEARLVRRPVHDLILGKRQCLLLLNTTARRHESSSRRSKHRLNIKPDASFLPSNPPKQDHIIFNPPSSAPSVFHTPLLFMPKEDKRKQLFAATLAKQPPTSTRLPPLIPKFKPLELRHHLKDTDIAEIQRLRNLDPDKWTVFRLSKKYNCAKSFISICVDTPAEKKERDRQKMEAAMARWGPRRTKAREDRIKRKELALKDA
jgi:hypothetical protein